MTLLFIQFIFEYLSPTWIHLASSALIAWFIMSIALVCIDHFIILHTNCCTSFISIATCYRTLLCQQFFFNFWYVRFVPTEREFFLHELQLTYKHFEGNKKKSNNCSVYIDEIFHLVYACVVCLCVRVIKGVRWRKRSTEKKMKKEKQLINLENPARTRLKMQAALLRA